MSVSGIIYVGCPRCHLELCSGVVDTPAAVRQRYADNVSFCLVCRQWFKWADAEVTCRSAVAADPV